MSLCTLYLCEYHIWRNNHNVVYHIMCLTKTNEDGRIRWCLSVYLRHLWIFGIIHAAMNLKSWLFVSAMAVSIGEGYSYWLVVLSWSCCCSFSLPYQQLVTVVDGTLSWRKRLNEYWCIQWSHHNNSCIHTQTEKKATLHTACLQMYVHLDKKA